MEFVFSLFLLLVFPLYCGGATPGVLQLDSKTFDKVSWTFVIINDYLWRNLLIYISLAKSMTETDFK